jgi:hypothetical protein
MSGADGDVSAKAPGSVLAEGLDAHMSIKTAKNGTIFLNKRKIMTGNLQVKNTQPKTAKNI